MENTSTSTSESIKDTLESIVIAFALAFVFRAYVVEAFVIPTGSMAPTLLGEHAQVVCRDCGYRFAVDVESTHRIQRLGKTGIERPYITVSEGLSAICPLCGQSTILPPGTRIGAGDRILVLKYIYSLAEPRRWDVVVFKAPHEPRTNFIKRLVGLPNEELLIVEGNVYTRSVDPRADDTARQWRVQRKTVRPKVQEAVWQPLHRTIFQSLELLRDVQHGGLSDELVLSGPWKPAGGSGLWIRTPRGGFELREAEPTELIFDFQQLRGRPRYAYNQFKGQFAWVFEDEPVEDIRLALVVEPTGTGLNLALQTQARWENLDAGRPVMLVGRIDSQGGAWLELPEHPDPVTGRPRVLTRGYIGLLLPGASYLVELWYVDQEASLWVNGQRVLAACFELPMETVMRRPPLPPGFVPDLRIRVAGAPARIHRIELDRDLHYSAGPAMGSFHLARGTLIKERTRYEANPVVIGPDQFFCLGDNSPLSSDSRYWRNVDPWVAERMFQGREVLGLVPHQLMIGRAFFVYWPAMHALRPYQIPLVPNFGDMRFIR